MRSVPPKHLHGRMAWRTTTFSPTTALRSE